MIYLIIICIVSFILIILKLLGVKFNQTINKTYINGELTEHTINGIDQLKNKKKKL